MARNAPTLTPATDERRIYAPLAERAAALRPASWNAEERTVDVVWTTGSRGVKFNWDACGMIEEELATSPSSVRLDRLNAGAAVLNAHQSYDLSGQIGVVVPGSARMVQGQGLATLQLSDRADLAPIVADIGAGVIRNLSVGYTVHAYEIEQRPGQLPLYRAVDWEPVEISFVPVPFDAAAQVRSGHNPQPCVLRTVKLETTVMSNRHSHSVLDDSAPPALDDSAPASIAQIREYVGGAVSEYGLSREQASALTLDFAERGLTLAGARDELMAAMAERQRRATSTVRTANLLEGAGGQSFENPDFYSRAVSDALYARMSGTAPSEPGRQFMNMTLVQLAADGLTRAGISDAHRMAPDDVLNRAWGRSGGYLSERSAPGMTTSDFPGLLMESGNRHLVSIFGAFGSPIKQLSRETSSRDFRAVSGLQLSGFGTLPKVLEDGELTHGTFVERKETYQVETFAKQFTLTRQAIINDDLGAFGNANLIMARSAAETEAALFAAVINSNPAMADNKALFHADHGNLAGAGGAPDVATLSAGRLAMRSQKDDDGVTPLSAAPKYILVSPQRETAIEQLLVATTVPTNSNEANPFSGKLTPLVDPRLIAAPWFLFADPALSPVIEHAYLDGRPGPHIEMKDHWNSLGQSFRVYMDLGVGIVDWRGAYKNPGA